MAYRLYVFSVVFGVGLAPSGSVTAQQYPTKSVRILASGIGGATDFTARFLAAGLAARVGQPVIVDNRAGGLVPGEIVARAPDAHTLMLTGAVTWLSPYMRSDMPFDPVRDFAPITLAVTQPNVIVVYPGLPVKSVRELIALAKDKPGVLNYASSGNGNSTHLAAELFKSRAGVNIVQISYKLAAPAFTDLFSGRIEVMFPVASGAAPHVGAGRLRALAVASLKPSELAPGLPTVAVAAGLPGYEYGSTLGLFAGASASAAIVNMLNREIVNLLTAPEARERFFKAGMDIVASSPAQFAEAIKVDMAQSGKVIQSASIRTD
jgi:tripartite-type tricarboxylate transporter receptor subunit TctC